ncbi:MAG: tRNA (adenosine(37)-N6)-threonylcarbamoyltransferase complex transferase subunit TsaD [Patescibacteria group bacterium]
MKILALETSCDETAAAVLEEKGGKFILHSSVVASQVDIHAKTGGIVPEVAAREHVTKIQPVIKEAAPDINNVDIIAVTRGPGLITSLMVGLETAKTLAYALKKPLIALNHIEGHFYGNWLPVPPGEEFTLPKIKLPALSLIVSGGHTELVLMKNHGVYKKIGETLDDAVGEAFDKVAKILDLGYPGGPIIEKMAQEGDPKKIDLPRPLLKQKNYDFSFSGLKTAVLYLVRKQAKIDEQYIKNVAASFQQASIDVLISKTLRAAKDYKVKSIMISGGVAANQTLIKAFKKAVRKELPLIPFYSPLRSYSTDNAAMMAMAAYFHAKKKDYTSWHKVRVDPNLAI